MARTALATQLVSGAGIVPAYTAANVDGHAVEHGTILHVKNGGGAPINVTLITPGTVRGRAIADDVIAVANGGEKMISLSDRALEQTSGADEGTVYVDFSDVTSVTVAAVQAA